MKQEAQEFAGADAEGLFESLNDELPWTTTTRKSLR
jgi:hypothetical protein